MIPRESLQELNLDKADRGRAGAQPVEAHSMAKLQQFNCGLNHYLANKYFICQCVFDDIQI